MTDSPHIPEILAEDDLGLDRPYMKPDTQKWERGIRCRKLTAEADGSFRESVVRCVDMGTRQMRIVGPAEHRTKWYSIDEWEPLVEKSAAEKAREAAVVEIQSMLDVLSDESKAFAEVLADDQDPIKRLMKLRALKTSGMLKDKRLAKSGKSGADVEG